MARVTLNDILKKHNNDYSDIEKKFHKKSGLSPTIRPCLNTKQKEIKKVPSVSIVIPAYNSSKSLPACLASIEQNSFNHNHQEKLQVIVVDDGSTDNSWKTLKSSNFNLNLIILKQKNFGQAQALNTAISRAEGEVIISCDSDMVLSYFTIENFAINHSFHSNIIWTGFRSNVTKNDPRVNEKNIRKIGVHKYTTYSNDERIIFPSMGWPNNMCLSSNNYKNFKDGKKLYMPDDGIWLLPDLVIGALFSLDRETFKKIGGYDERFSGWGCTDSYLAAKAISSGHYVAPLYSSSGLHIEHKDRSKKKRNEFNKNRKLFFNLINCTEVNKHPNWLKNANKRIEKEISFSPSKNIIHRINTISPSSEYYEIDNLNSLGKYSKALNLLKNISNKNKIKYFQQLGKSLFGLKKYSATTMILKNGLDKYPNDKKIFSLLITTYAAQGFFSSANKQLNIILNSPQNQSKLNYWKISSQKRLDQGKNFFKQNDFQLALRCFEASLIIDPKNKSAKALRKKCLLNSDNTLV